jgi:hypothetical protein
MSLLSRTSPALVQILRSSVASRTMIPTQSSINLLK